MGSRLTDYRGRPFGPPRRRMSVTVTIDLEAGHLLDTGPTKIAETIFGQTQRMTQGDATLSVQVLFSTAVERAAHGDYPAAMDCLQAATHALRLHAETNERNRG